MKSGDLPKLIATLLVCLGAGFLGSLATMKSIPVWYAGLNKPSFSPPNYLFGPVWTALYILMAVAAFLVWRRAAGSGPAGLALAVFVVQLVLNVLWSVLFFALRMPGAAFFEIILLWLAILATIWLFGRTAPAAAWLLIPYVLWVTFAAVLNFSLWRLN